MQGIHSLLYWCLTCCWSDSGRWWQQRCPVSHLKDERKYYISSASDSCHQGLVVLESVERNPGHRQCLCSLSKLANLSKDRHDWLHSTFLSTTSLGETSHMVKHCLLKCSFLLILVHVYMKTEVMLQCL